MRRSGRSMNRKDRDRGAEMRLTERTMRREDDVGGRARVTSAEKQMLRGG